MNYPKQSKHGIQHFEQFAYIGDSVSWTPKQQNPHGLTLTARLEFDDITSPFDYECYSAKKISEWHNNSWYYVGIILSVHKGDVTLDDHAVSIWGLECNYNARSNLYFAQVCKDLESEALQAGEKVIDNLLS